MAESPDRDVVFRRNQKDREVIEQNDHEDEPLEDERQVLHDRGDGDVRENGPQRRNREVQGDASTVMSYKLSVKPKNFEGVEDWEEYISHFEICAELGGWTDHEKLLALVMALKVPARIFYISLSATDRRTMPWSKD